MKKEYNLDFYEALKIVMAGGCVKGDGFVDGVYIKLNKKGELVNIDAGRLYIEDPVFYIKGLSYQKYRELSVMTMQELCQ